MKILLITLNLYKSTGGGQTVYKKIIEAAPNLDFYYFVTDEENDVQKPSNAHPVSLLGRRSLTTLVPPPFPSYRVIPLEFADQYARSVADQAFDIVDIPDYYTFGSVLKHAFQHHNVEVGRIVLAMHGNISNSIEINWGSQENNVLELQMLEHEQFKSADSVYGIAPSYIKEWQAKHSREVTLIDPSHFVTKSSARPDIAINQDIKPSLYCIGRTERRKGNDLFIELVRWCRPDSYEKVAHIGEQDYSNKGIGSSTFLSNIAKQRDIQVDYLQSMNSVELAELYAARSIIVLPVRYDALNLVALEALFSGCPVVISNAAGVCDYLDNNYPGLPYIKIDLRNFYSAISNLQDLIDNYDKHRQALRTYLIKKLPLLSEHLQIESIYKHFITEPKYRPTVAESISIEYQERGRSQKERVARLARSLLSARSYNLLRRFALNPQVSIIEKIKNSGYFGDAKFFGVLIDSISLPQRLSRVAGHSEHNIDSLRAKLDEIYVNATSPLYRCNFWREIARIERVRGNELMAVTYELRILRLIGRDDLGLLPCVLATLNKHGFTHEAEAAQAMFGNADLGQERVYQYLKDAYRRNLSRQDKPWQLLNDNRSSQVPRVSVIVSLYNAAEKLNFFLTALSHQTLNRKESIEIVLVDSGSPSNEHDVLNLFLQKNSLNVVYARSAERETIQAAWNRGIGLARSAYLVFLGVDETLYPEGLEVLADELDQHPEVDWVMANSLVTEVENNGLYHHDVMSYNRNGASKEHTYLETCYLSWVGGMYRKTLHERFGYYDETFGAAGDTEIKNRILPYIKVKFIPKMLGVFLNYPDGQTTASPKAEIEDLRAWYMHRTPGGVHYAFEDRSVEEVKALLYTALGYRKSYCGHMSCDIEYAYYLANYIADREPQSTISLNLVDGLGEMLDRLRSMEFTSKPASRSDSLNVLIKAWRSSKTQQQAHRATLKTVSLPSYGVLNDNRYEQHSWLWKSK